MKGILLILIALLVFVFGGYAMKQLDAGLDAARRERDDERD